MYELSMAVSSTLLTALLLLCPARYCCGEEYGTGTIEWRTYKEMASSNVGDLPGKDLVLTFPNDRNTNIFSTQSKLVPSRPTCNYDKRMKPQRKSSNFDTSTINRQIGKRSRPRRRHLSRALTLERHALRIHSTNPTGYTLLRKFKPTGNSLKGKFKSIRYSLTRKSINGSMSKIANDEQKQYARQTIQKSPIEIEHVATHSEKDIKHLVSFVGKCAYLRQYSMESIIQDFDSLFQLFFQPFKFDFHLHEVACVDKLRAVVSGLNELPNFYTNKYRDLIGREIIVLNETFYFDKWKQIPQSSIIVDKIFYVKTFNADFLLTVLHFTGVGAALILASMLTVFCGLVCRRKFIKPPLVDLSRYSEDEVPKFLLTNQLSCSVRTATNTRTLPNVYVNPLPDVAIQSAGIQGSIRLSDHENNTNSNNEVDKGISYWSSTEIYIPESNIGPEDIYATVKKSHKSCHVMEKVQEGNNTQRESHDIQPFPNNISSPINDTEDKQCETRDIDQEGLLDHNKQTNLTVYGDKNSSIEEQYIPLYRTDAGHPGIVDSHRDYDLVASDDYDTDEGTPVDDLSPLNTPSLTRVTYTSSPLGPFSFETDM